jgi:hypothetical protein
MKFSPFKLMMFFFLARLVATCKNVIKLRPKILIAPVEIAGYYKNLCDGFKAVGQPYDFLSYAPHRFGYGGETKTQVFLIISKEFHNKYLGDKKYPRIAKSILFRIYLLLSKLHVFWTYYQIIIYDSFIFSFGLTLFEDHRDVLLIKKLGKKIICQVGHGSEARPAYIDGSMHADGGDLKDVGFLTIEAKKTFLNIKFLEQHADIIICAPYSSQFLKSKCVNAFALGIPLGIIEDKTHTNHLERSSLMIRILHSPSHKRAKGTSVILDAITNLKLKGYAIDFVTVSGRPHKEVLAELKVCDFVIDQVYSDSPLAGFAAEAAFFGKPALVAGYGLVELKKHVNDDMWPPSMICHPEDLEQAIEELIANKFLREQLGHDSKEFVGSKWSNFAVATRFLSLINDKIPDDWWLDPNDVNYIHGAGQSIDQTRQIVNELVKNYGLAALKLSDRPLLEAEILKLIDFEEKVV